MDYFAGSENILDYLILAVKNAAANTFDPDKSIFEMAKTDKYPEQITDLAESFGMMIVKLEARELLLEQTIQKLQNVHQQLKQELQKKQVAAAALQKERNQLEDLVRERRGEIVKSNHKLQIEILSRKRIEEEREQLIFEITEALTRMKQLKRLLPICPSCKNIRDDNGYWNNLEIYLDNHSNAEFSHGICRSCMKKLYPEHYEKRYGKINLE
ncbi:hypothetical protein KJ762_08340 [bacterium]|nr:hypothetical protein [bacterium]MBU1065361.1 hypothetical protein [bacterium]MBU1634502.1 hypothetical protein [bacterium]MBU1872214.1 hypothetical protein [bacterium]